MFNLIRGKWSFAAVINAIGMLFGVALICMACYSVTFLTIGCALGAPFIPAVTLVFTTKAMYESCLVGITLFTFLLAYC